jgi:vancomycin permeability regulator SanA
MQQKIKYAVNTSIRIFFKYKEMVISVCIASIVLSLLIVVACNLKVNSYKKYILTSTANTHVSVGIVLGSGITKDGRPFKELLARLDVAAQALNDGRVDKLILSGDNRFKNYDEPKAMRDYLISSKHISSDKLQPDYAGRSTYESCERAVKVFDVKEAIIFSAGSHLPRAIFLCRHFGIRSFGISSGVEANNSGRRELMARVKAVYNAYIKGEDTLLGARL